MPRAVSSFARWDSKSWRTASLPEIRNAATVLWCRLIEDAEGSCHVLSKLVLLHALKHNTTRENRKRFTNFMAFSWMFGICCIYFYFGTNGYSTPWFCTNWNVPRTVF